MLAGSVMLAAKLYPDYYDWQYTVVSALASSKHNPGGFQVFSAGLGLSLLLLWPYSALFRSTSNFGFSAIRAGIASGFLMCMESIIEPNWPERLDKVHELLALICFLGMYSGILTICIKRWRQSRAFSVPALLIISPLVAIGICQLSLYLDQRDLGWVDQSWREMGIPLWQSFAFWQWLAVWFLWLAIGALGVLQLGSRNRPD